ncbi:hypothetical protein [Pseudomonas sp. SWRI154]|uniref:hypothetical protein n=1 Tax=Pseudomonas sp. SWRI154 TaxID=2745501 RepID=UPI001647EC7F|nr:hypothetical protein [Pseudomonas sp. SWRI154]MBC3366061.1 hypothetical protein [Pseudomonas sp. SWRI154]
MDTKDGVTFLAVDPELVPPRILQATAHEVPFDLLEDCTLSAILPSFVEVGWKIDFYMHTHKGTFSTSRIQIEAEHISAKKIERHLSSWAIKLSPGSQVSAGFYLYVGKLERESPRNFYLVK